MSGIGPISESLSGTEVAYAEKTSNTTVTATSMGAADLVASLPSATYDGVTRYRVEIFSPAFIPATPGSTFIYGSIIFGAVGSRPVVATYNGAFLGVQVFALPAGTYAVHFKAYLSAAGTGTVTGGTGTASGASPAFIRLSRA